MKGLLEEVLRSSIIIGNEDLAAATVKFALRNVIILAISSEMVIRISENE